MRLSLERDEELRDFVERVEQIAANVVLTGGKTLQGTAGKNRRTTPRKTRADRG
jgi:hypothetical protein